MDAAVEQVHQLKEELEATRDKCNMFELEVRRLNAEKDTIDGRVQELEYDCAEATEELMVSEHNYALFLYYYHYLTLPELLHITAAY